MTCIVACVKDNVVHMGADSLGSNGWSKTEALNSKVFIKEGFLIGCTGTFRHIDLLKYKLLIANHCYSDQEVDQYMRTTFIDTIIKLLKDNEADKDANFLVGFRGNLYEVQDDYSVLNCPLWGAAIGSGEDPARGSLYTTQNLGLAPATRLNLALEAAETVITTVQRPFILLSK